MPERKIINSAEFNADTLAREFENLNRAIPANAETKPLDGTPPAGAYIFHGPANIRLVLQYDIRTDTYVARLGVLVEIPDAS